MIVVQRKRQGCSKQRTMVLGVAALVVVLVVLTLQSDKASFDQRLMLLDSVLESVQTNATTDHAFTEELQESYQYHVATPHGPSHQQPDCGTDTSDYNTFFALPKNRHSRKKEDKTIYELFFKDTAEKLHYVEMGAFNGMGESNSRFFDICRQWTGLLVEPNPLVYPQLVKNRPNAHRASFAASCSQAQADNQTTVTFQATTNTMASQVESDYKTPQIEQTSQVPCGPLTPLLQHVLGGHVHFFSLDVENMEHAVLGNIDFSKVFIEILIAENLNMNCGEHCPSREAARAIMKQQGYVLFNETVERSDLYVHHQSKYLERMKQQQVQPKQS